MPNYTFKDKDSDEEFDIFLKVAELDDYKANNPNFTQVLKPLTIGYSVHRGKTSDVFNDRLKEIDKWHYGSKIETR